MTNFLHILAPAKLNLFLHVTGQRPDGYHLLQSVFQLIDLQDTVKLRIRTDGVIERLNPIPNVPAEDDLVVKAARLLKEKFVTPFGVDIDLDKQIPMGAGLGGGSSDAASTLLGLNQLWGLNIPQQELMTLGLHLGADVPFFLFGKNAFVEGVGEVITEITLKDVSYMVIFPGVSIPTKSIFSSPDLTRNRTPITIEDFKAHYADQMTLSNDLQTVATKKYSEVQSAIEWLENKFPGSRPLMTGSGSSVFCELPKQVEAANCFSELPTMWQGFKVQSLKQHSAYNLKSSINIQEGSRQVG